MKKSVKIALWVSIPVILAVAFAAPRIGLFGDRASSADNTQAPVPSQGQGQRPGGSQGRPQSRPQGGMTLPVNATIARPSYLTNGIRSAGTLLANEEIDIVSKVSGKVTGVFFREGSRVRKGDPW